jgi:hypothetical protein
VSSKDDAADEHRRPSDLRAGDHWAGSDSFPFCFLDAHRMVGEVNDENLSVAFFMEFNGHFELL